MKKMKKNQKKTKSAEKFDARKKCKRGNERGTRDEQSVKFG